MSYTISTDIFCDRCVTWVAGDTGNTIRKKNAARIRAKSKGWYCTTKIQLCPVCFKNWKKSKS